MDNGQCPIFDSIDDRVSDSNVADVLKDDGIVMAAQDCAVTFRSGIAVRSANAMPRYWRFA